MIPRFLFAIVGLGFAPLVSVAAGPWCFCQPYFPAPIIAYYPPVYVAPACNPCYSMGPMVVVNPARPAPAPNPGNTGASTNPIPNPLPPPKIQQLPGIGGKQPENKEMTPAGLGKTNEPAPKSTTPTDLKQTGGFANPEAAPEPGYKLEPLPKTEIPAPLKLDPPAKTDTPAPLKLDVPPASEALPTPRPSPLIPPPPTRDLPPNPLTVPTAPEGVKIPSITPPLPSRDPGAPATLQLPTDVPKGESDSISRSSPLTGQKSRFEVFAVEGTKDGETRRVGFFNHTDREVKLTVQGESVVLPKWSTIFARVPAGFKWKLDTDTEQSTQIPTDAPGIAIVIRR